MKRGAVTNKEVSVQVAGRRFSWRQLAATAALVVGGILVIVGWAGVSRYNEVWRQMPYFVSGGIGGLALILIGLGLYNAHHHATRSERSAEVLERLEALELGLAGEFDEVLRHLDPADAARTVGVRAQMERR